MIGYWLALLLVLSIPMIGMVFISILQNKLNDEHPITKVGLILLTAGLIVQLSRTIHFFHYGKYPIDVGVPLWLAKDLGACMLIFYFTYWKDRLEAKGALPIVKVDFKPDAQKVEVTTQKVTKTATKRVIPEDKPNVKAKTATTKRAKARVAVKKGKLNE